MNLSRSDLEVAYYVVSRFINSRLAAGKSVPAAVLPLFRRIELMSATGHESDCVDGQLEEELIGTAQAAHILECDPRHIRRLTNDLDGRQINGRWVFNKTVVEDYERSRSAARRAAAGTGRGISSRVG